VPDIWLATCAALPTGGPEAASIDAAFADLGMEARWAVWDDLAVDWSAAPLVAVRSTWDYTGRLDTFLTWAAGVDAVTALVNPLPVLRWNSRKVYLVELEALGVPVVPTRSVSAGESFTASGPTVLKPAVGASGRGLRLLATGEHAEAAGHQRVAQPLVASVRTEGEHSVYVLGGAVVAAAVKRAGPDDIRVHEEYGGHTGPADLTEELSDLALAAVRAVEHRHGSALPYARVDVMRLADGGLVVSEVELIEPGLYASVLPEVPVAYARALADVLDGDDRARRRPQSAGLPTE